MNTILDNMGDSFASGSVNFFANDMVCMPCFQTKSKKDWIKDCRNPRCWFYRISSSSLLSFPNNEQEVRDIQKYPEYAREEKTAAGARRVVAASGWNNSTWKYERNLKEVEAMKPKCNSSRGKKEPSNKWLAGPLSPSVSPPSPILEASAISNFYGHGKPKSYGHPIGNQKVSFSG